MFDKQQIKELLNNKYVDKCSSTSITYNKAFKLKAIGKYYQAGYSPNMIFKQAGFNLNIIGRKKAEDCLVRWRRIYKTKGKQGLIKENRGNHGQGGRAKTNYDNDQDKIKYLETRLAYFEEENKMLKKMKKLNQA